MKNRLAGQRRLLEEKESMKWLNSFARVAEVQALCPETLLVSMGDRESDIHDLFALAARDPAGPKLLVLSVRFAEVTLQPPRDRRLPAVELWAVHLHEENTDDPEPIEWMLLTTVPVHTFDDAVERAEWYAARWGIEVFHRTLKSGCRIKDRQLGTAARLQACLGIDMVVAWRIDHLTMLGREVPDHPCTVFFEEVEWKALHCYHYQTSVTPDEPPSMAQAVRRVVTSDVAARARPVPMCSGVVCSISTWPSTCITSSPTHLRLEAGAPTPRGISRAHRRLE